MDFILAVSYHVEQFGMFRLLTSCIHLKITIEINFDNKTCNSLIDG